MKLLADEGVVALGIELGISQHAAHRRSMCMGLSDQGGQVGTVIPRGLPCRLEQDELSLQVDDGRVAQTITCILIRPNTRP